MNELVSLAAALAGPWADLYDGSAAVQAAVAFVHFGGLLLAGGLALAADRGVLRGTRRGWPDRLAAVREVEGSHRLVLLGLVATVASGVLLLGSDVEALLPSPAFWLKMGAFALLLANGALLQRAERRVLASAGALDTGPAPLADHAERLWRPLRRASIRSAGLWFAVLLLGTLLTLA